MRISPFPPQNISDFDDHFSQKTLARAQNLVDANAAYLHECTPERLVARIRRPDGTDFNPRVTAQGEHDCDCTDDVRPCQHIAAALILAITQQPSLESLVRQLSLKQAQALLLEFAHIPEVRTALQHATPPQAIEKNSNLEPLDENAEITEEHLRAQLENPREHLELMRFLCEKGNQAAALEIAAVGVRIEISRLKRGRGDITVYHRGEAWHTTQTSFEAEMLELIGFLREQQPSFEWEEALFRVKPSLNQYKTLKIMPAFAKTRDALLELVNPDLKFEIMIEDDDRATIETMFEQHPTPSYARKVKHLFPDRAKEIFKEAIVQRANKHTGHTYREAAQLAKDYQSLEDETVFAKWLENFLKLYARRPLLVDEFAKQGLQV
jgi:Tfp pilus assembly protein PilE